jgi:hypothetical protein
LHDAVSSDHLDYYLDELAFRFLPPEVGQARAARPSTAASATATGGPPVIQQLRR